jgi:hypothetical protein
MEHMTLRRAIELRTELLGWDMAEVGHRTEISLDHLEGFFRHDQSVYCSRAHLNKIASVLYDGLKEKGLVKTLCRDVGRRTDPWYITRDLFLGANKRIDKDIGLDRLLAEKRRLVIGWTPSYFMEDRSSPDPQGIGAEWVSTIASYMGMRFEWRHFPTQAALQKALVGWEVHLSGVMIQWPIVMPPLKLHSFPNIIVEHDHSGEIWRYPICIGHLEDEVQMGEMIDMAIDILRINGRFPKETRLLEKTAV